ncbi:MAG: molybdopterin-synthase adenylyltransferase MoeB [Ferruginibacter sp.]
MITNDTYERYQRQLILKGFGETGQQKLLAAKVLVVGAGGLGCPALQYLAAAGIGNIGIVDDDVVALSNLHRQVLFSTNDIGLSKAIKATEVLHLLNPCIQVTAHNERLTPYNALDIIREYDIVIDGTDNFASRYLINDACVLLNKTLVYGAVSQFEGQVAVFNSNANNGAKAANYRDLFPAPPKDSEVLNCAEAGVLGVLPGIIGTMQASETIKLITGIGTPLVNSLLTYNALTNQVYTILLHANKETSMLIPADEEAFRNTNYEWLCGADTSQQEIDAAAFDEIIAAGNADIIDVREYDEAPMINDFPHSKIPLSQLKNNIPSLQKDRAIVFCQSGKRSLQAAQLLSAANENKKIYSLKGGILNWIKSQQAIQIL